MGHSVLHVYLSPNLRRHSGTTPPVVRLSIVPFLLDMFSVITPLQAFGSQSLIGATSATSMPLLTETKPRHASYQHNV